MNCIDLTLSDDDDILYVKKHKCKEISESYDSIIHQTTNNIFNYYYGTEDLTEKYLSIQHPLTRKIAKHTYSIKCPKCPEYFINCNFLTHIMDHYKYEYSNLDNLLSPKIANLSNVFNDATIRKAFRCEICLIDFDSPIGLGQHLQAKHVSQDMPYVCFICNFYRTSIFSQLKQHFYDYHKSTEFLFCPFCIQCIELPTFNSMDMAGTAADSNIVLDATVFLVHIEKHFLKKQFSCDKCVLKFTTKLLLIFHKTVYHQGRQISITDNQNCSANNSQDKSGNPLNKIIKKSLNVTTQPIDVSKLSINSYRLAMVCAECRESLQSLNLAQHYQSFNMCTHCGFRSYCSISFRKHMKTFHNQSELSLYKTIDIYHKGVLICECGYQSMHGDGMASHLYRCREKSCFTRSRVHVNAVNYSVNNQPKMDNYLEMINLQKL